MQRRHRTTLSPLISNIALLNMLDSMFHFFTSRATCDATTFQFNSAFHLGGKVSDHRIPTRLLVSCSDLLVAHGPRYAGGLELKFLVLGIQNDLNGLKSFFDLKNELLSPEYFVHPKEKMTSFWTYFLIEQLHKGSTIFILRQLQER